VITGEIQGRKRHVLRIRSITGVILPRFRNDEIVSPKQDEILGIDVTVGTFIGGFARLVELRL